MTCLQSQKTRYVSQFWFNVGPASHQAGIELTRQAAAFAKRPALIIVRVPTHMENLEFCLKKIHAWKNHEKNPFPGKFMEFFF